METFVKEKAAHFEGDRFVLTDYGLDVSNYIMGAVSAGLKFLRRLRFLDLWEILTL